MVGIGAAMNRFRVVGGFVNLNHIVMVERRDGIQFARLVSGATVALADIYPLAHELFKVSGDTWVNPVHVSVVGVGYNKNAAFRDIMKDREKDDQDYTQVRVETVLGTNHQIWSDIYGVDEVDYLAELLDQGE